MTPSAQHLRAILFALTGFTLWVISDTLLKSAGTMPVPKHEFMALSGLGGIAIILLVTGLRGEFKKLRAKKYGGLTVLGLLHLANFSFWIMALMKLPLANLYTVMFLSPIIVAILAAIFLRERFSWTHGLAIVAGFIGVVIAVNPDHLAHDPAEWKSYGFVFAAAFTISCQMLMLRILGPRETRECAAFYPRIIFLIGSLIAGLVSGFKPIPIEGLVLGLASGAVGALGWLFMAHAYKLAPAATVAPFHYSEIVTGALLGYIFFNDVPKWNVLAGAAIIIASGIYVITHTRRSAQILKEESHN